MKTIPLCMIRVLRNLTLALYEGLALQDYNNKAPDDKGCNSTMLGYRSMCIGIAVLAHKACVVTALEIHKVFPLVLNSTKLAAYVRSLFHSIYFSPMIRDTLNEACSIKQ